MKFHDITRNYLGDFGRYQVLVFLILLAVRSPSVIHNMGFVFFAASPDHWCAHPTENPNLNLTDEEWMIYTIPASVKEGKKSFSSCKVYSWVGDVNMTSQQIEARLEQLRNGTTFPEDYQRPCKRREFNTWTTVKNSLTTELDLVCDRKWMKSLIGSIYAAGWIVGGPIAGYMADRFGRQVVLRVTCIMTVLLGFANPFANTYIPFLVARFFLSAFLNASLAIGFTVCIELVGPRWRSITANLYMLVWAVGYMALAGIAYLLREKLKFMLVTVAPSVILLILV